MDASSRSERDMRIRQQEVVAELGQQALEEDDLDQLIHDATVAVAETLDTDYCEVLELLPGGDEVFLRQGVGWQDGFAGNAAFPTDSDSQVGYTLSSEEPIIVDDLSTESRFSGSDLLVDHGVVSGISVVIGSVEEPWGVLGTHTTERREFTDYEANFVRNIANLLDSAIESEQAHSELEEIYGRISDAFFALDEEWRFTFLNDRSHEIINPEGRTLVGENIWEAFPEAVDRKFKEKYERAMYEQETVTFEGYYPEPLDAWFEVRAYPSETGLSVYFRDITDRKERERQLEVSEQRYRTLVEYFPNGIVTLFDHDLQYELAAGQGFDRIPVEPADVEGHHFSEVWDGATVDTLQPVFEAALNGEERSIELDYAGQEWILHAVPITDERGDVFAGMTMVQDITERKEHQRRLERYKQYTDDILNAVDDVFYVIDDGGDLRRWNESVCEVTGYSDAEIESMCAFDFFGEDADRVANVIAEGFETGSVLVEAPIHTKDGKSIPYEFSAATLEDPEGDPVLAGIGRDITARKERERELAKYETIVETINDGIYVKDAEGRFTMVNDAYVELTGYDRDELLGEHASLVVDEETIEQSREMRRETADGEATDLTMEAVIQRADGTTVPTEGTFATLQTDGEQEQIGVVRDVTERKEQRRRIEESERRYRTLVENFPNGAVGLFDEDLRYTVVGGQLVDTLGIEPEDRLGHSISELHPDDLVEQFKPHFETALDGERASFEVEYHGRHLSVHMLPVRNGANEVFAGMLVVQDVTERREAQRELRESEAKFRMIAESLEEIVWMATADSEEWIYINPAFEEVWGRDREELYDEPLSFLEAVHPDDRERIQEEFTALPEDEFDEEFRIVRPDGEIRWVHARGSRVQDGEMVRTVGVGEDVTDRVERERALEESERRYRTLAEHFPNGAVGVYDQDLRYTLTAGAVLGDRLPSAARLEGDRVPEIFPPDTVEDLEPLFRAAIEDGVTDSTMTEFGGRHWRVWATPLRNADGEIFAGLSFAQDITEQIERDRELERALDLLERTERIADVGGWEIDVETRDVFWTDHIFDLLEVDADEEPPLDEALDMYHAEDQPMVVDAVEKALTSGDSFDIEVRIRTDGGDIRWLRLQGVPETVNGDVVSFRGAVQDITERKRREQRLEELVDKLEESNERLEQFAYAASHDLQEPLRMVSSYLQLIEQRYADELDEDGEEFLEFAIDGADRMRHMIDGLLKYSRVDTRGDPFEPVDLDAVLADARNDLQVRIQESGAEINAESLPCVEGDDGQLRQVFQNLLDNAIEYSGDEPPQVSISAEQASDRWVISVSDEGIGIDPADADRVFEVFQSLHTSEEHDGTGIGLALCKRIVERHGGDIWVASESGDGATVSFTLPVVGDADE